MVPVQIVDCLGRMREPARIFPDGSWNCPFCSAAVIAGSPAHTAQKCPSPGCFARGGDVPLFPPDRAHVILAEQEALEAERKARADRARWHAEQAEAARKAEADHLGRAASEAAKRGACRSCAIDSARFSRAPKFIKHRAACPRGDV